MHARVPVCVNTCMCVCLQGYTHVHRARTGYHPSHKLLHCPCRGYHPSKRAKTTFQILHE